MGKEKKQSNLNLLKLAIDLGDMKLCQDLVRDDVTIESKLLDCGGLTPVLYALAYGKLEIAEDLILKGASVEGSDVSYYRGWTPFHTAAYNGHVQVLRALFRKAPRAIMRCCQPVHPIHLAIANGHTECVQLIVDHARKGRTTFSTFQNHLTEKPKFKEQYSQIMSAEGAIISTM